MEATDRKRLRDQVTERLLAKESGLPTSRLGRLGGVGMTTLHGGRLALHKALRRATAGGEVNVAALAGIVRSIGRLKGGAMKMGQLLGTMDTGLSVEARTALSALQTHAPAMSLGSIHEILRQELGARAQPLLENLAPEPLAVASVGQVHRARLPDGTAVAVKVQYPGIRKAIERDFGPASVGSAVASLIFPAAKLKSFVREARTRFLEECDYGREARCQQKLFDLFADHPTIVIPRVHTDYCTGRVLCTTLIEGVHLDAYLASNPSQKERDRFGEALFDFYTGSLFKFGIYSCDPHPGNYLFCADGRMAMLDFGCARELGPSFVDSMAALTHAVQADERALLHSALVDLGVVRAVQSYDYETARLVARAFYGPMLKDEVVGFEEDSSTEMDELRKRKKAVLKFTLPGEFLFQFRVRLGLAAVLSRMGARANWYRLTRAQLAARIESGAGEALAIGGPSKMDVVLIDSGDNIIPLIREIRAATGVRIKEAKDFIEGVPTTIKHALAAQEAEELRQRLEALGAKAELRLP